MKQLSHFSIIALLCIIVLTSCGSTLTDLDKNFHNANQAVEALFNELPKGDMKILKEAVKFKESDKLSDYQKDEFFKQLAQKNFKASAKKAKLRDGYTEVVCDITRSDGSVKEKKFKLIKEDNVWKTEIGFSELQDAIYK